MKKNDVSKQLEQVVQRLNAILHILFETVGRKEQFSMRDRIRILSSLGISPAEIAKILGTTRNYVNKELSLIRKSAKTKQGEESG